MQQELVLNVAEKPSVAKEIANVLGGSSKSVRVLSSKFNPVYEFPYRLSGREVQMRVTSVRGHVLNLDFEQRYQDWHISISKLFDAPVVKTVLPDNQDVVRTLEESSHGISSLALWLDCDREGEAIAFEVISIVTKVAGNVPVRRAHFSALTRRDIETAAQSMSEPQRSLAEAVEARQEIDLRIGAAFTRLLTTQLRPLINLGSKKVISYGPCQCPTFGFIVKRYLERAEFRSEKFWYLALRYEDEEHKADFAWNRNRLFDLPCSLALYEDCVDVGRARVLSVSKREVSKYRPYPLATVPLQKLAAKKLRFSSDHTMKLAENLYQSGRISYPRTETDHFKSTIDLRALVMEQTRDQNWGRYASKLMDGEFKFPKKGDHDDNSHPPIHPVKSVARGDVSADEWKLYELITRHFLACCSKDALGNETEVQVAVGFEEFHAKALVITEKNFLEVYPYQTWSESTLPDLSVGQVFRPISLFLKEGKTEPPALLSEADLISLMDKNGIGTDATIHQHIKTIQEREYVVKTPQNLFVPTTMGIALYKAFNEIGLTVTQPLLRASMERDMSAIAQGTKEKSQVLYSCLEEMFGVFLYTESNFDRFSAICRQVMAQEEASQAACLNCKAQSHRTQDCPRGNAGPRTAVCYRCGQPGHFASACQSDSSGKTDTCYLCHQPGHYANACPQSQGAGKKHKVPRKPWKKGAKGKKATSSTN